MRIIHIPTSQLAMIIQGSYDGTWESIKAVLDRHSCGECDAKPPRSVSIGHIDRVFLVDTVEP